MRTAITAPARAAFAARVGAPVLAHGDPAGARSPGDGAARGGGRHRRRRGDRRAASARTGAIGEGEVVAGPGWTLTALATPGHTADHLSFAWAEGERALLRRPGHGLGDDADLAARRRPRCLPREPRAAAGAATRRSSTPATARRSPTRGGHRATCWRTAATREAEILAALARGPATVAALVARDLCRRRPGAAPGGGAQRARAPHRPRRARPRGGGGAGRDGRLAAGRYPIGRGVPKKTRCRAFSMWARMRSRAAGPSPAAMAA